MNSNDIFLHVGKCKHVICKMRMVVLTEKLKIELRMGRGLIIVIMFLCSSILCLHS